MSILDDFDEVAVGATDGDGGFSVVVPALPIGTVALSAQLTTQGVYSPRSTSVVVTVSAPDAGPPDAGLPDAGALDAGLLDAGADSGLVDAGDDAGASDAGPSDAGELDAGCSACAPDAGVGGPTMFVEAPRTSATCDVVYQVTSHGALSVSGRAPLHFRLEGDNGQAPPEGLRIDEDTGAVSWLPGPAQRGVHRVTSNELGEARLTADLTIDCAYTTGCSCGAGGGAGALASVLLLLVVRRARARNRLG